LFFQQIPSLFFVHSLARTQALGSGLMKGKWLFMPQIGGYFDRKKKLFLL
jgi:hypothetical protein